MSKLMFGSNGGIVGNGKTLALCLWDTKMIYLLKNPYLRNCSLSIGYDFEISFDISLYGSMVEIVEDEPGLIQRILTEDITPLQMTRLVREKLSK